jgi:hypothetical protein
VGRPHGPDEHGLEQFGPDEHGPNKHGPDESGPDENGPVTPDGPATRMIPPLCEGGVVYWCMSMLLMLIEPVPDKCINTVLVRTTVSYQVQSISVGDFHPRV